MNAGVFFLLRGFGSSGGGIITPPVAATYTPATIVARYFQLRALASWPDPSLPGDQQGAWPVYVSGEPTEPGDVLTTYDTTGLMDGRGMRTGEKLEHQGVQVRVRADNYNDGYAKATQLQESLDSAAGYLVPFADASFTLNNASRSGGIGYLGPEPETRRALFTFNLRVTLTRLED
jgi:hypothetical protein